MCFLSSRGLFDDISLFPWPIILCIHPPHCGVDIFLFFLDWNSEINDFFFTLFLNRGDRIAFHSLSPYLCHTCIYFYVFYRDPVVYILCIWCYPNSICVEFLSGQIQSITFRFQRYWIYFQIYFSPLLPFCLPPQFLPPFLLSSIEMIFSVSYSVKVEHIKYISRNEFCKSLFLDFCHLRVNKLSHEDIVNSLNLWKWKEICYPYNNFKITRSQNSKYSFWDVPSNTDVFKAYQRNGFYLFSVGNWELQGLWLS